MIERPFSSVTRADVDALVASARREDRLIEYKRSLPSNSDHDKREFLADVSAFANAAGGDLLYGVDEEDGVPTAVPGLTISSVDDEILRLQSILRDGIQPRIPALEIRAIEAIGVDPVILLRVHPSWTGPHMVVFKGGSRFFVRDVGQRHQLDVNELRDAFVAAEGVGERLRRFRDERVAKVLIGDTPIATWSHPATIIHVIPAMLRRGNSLDPRAVGDKWMVLNETKFIYYPSSRINFDGLLLYSGPAYEHDKRSHSYVQVFRTVAVEAVSTFSNRAEPYMNFYGGQHEADIIGMVESARKFHASLALGVPVYVAITLLRFRGVAIMTEEALRAFTQHAEYERDMYMLPEVLLEPGGPPVATALRPALDTMWQAAGFKGSPNFDDDGTWRRKRGA